MASGPDRDQRRTRAWRLWGTAVALLVAVTCSALAVWQLQRLQWKEALLARIAALPNERPATLPAAADWPGLDRARDEYRVFRVQGRWLPDSNQLVVASTDLGQGHWVMTALAPGDGTVVWVNRGFVDAAHRAAALEAPLPDLLATPRTALLRFPEQVPLPGLERILRDPRQLSAKAGLRAEITAPFFLDLSAAPAVSDWPRAGLTRLTFPNNHFGYAVTWALLALGALFGARFWWRYADE